jgi:hypothetical protein
MYYFQRNSALQSFKFGCCISVAQREQTFFTSILFSLIEFKGNPLTHQFFLIRLVRNALNAVYCHYYGYGLFNALRCLAKKASHSKQPAFLFLVPLLGHITNVADRLDNPVALAVTVATVAAPLGIICCSILLSAALLP